MNPIQARVKANVPAVVLALLGIIQAFAVELLWSFVVSEPTLYETNVEALIIWLQIAVLLAGILIIWLVYAINVARFVWIPSIGEFISPFWVGFLQFFTIHSLGFENPGYWFLGLATIIATMNWIAHVTMKRARSDPGNAAFFDQRGKAELSDFYPVIALIVVIASSGLGFILFGFVDWLVLVLLLVCFSSLVGQCLQLQRWWRRSVEDIS